MSDADEGSPRRREDEPACEPISGALPDATGGLPRPLEHYRDYLRLLARVCTWILDCAGRWTRRTSSSRR